MDITELCVICQETMSQDVVHPDNCPSHKFHKSCLEQWARKKNVCPIDQKPFVVIVGLDGSRCIVQPQEDEDGEGSNLLDFLQFMNRQFMSNFQEFLRAQQSNDNFRCQICDSSVFGPRAKPVPCGHEFHEACLMQRAGKANICPKRGCHLEFDIVHSQTGIHQLKMMPPMAVVNQLSAPPGFRCAVCLKPDVQRMRAITIPCGHLQHRGCLVEYIGRHKKCPECQSASTKVFCRIAGILNWDA